jgi:hypothetical protein
VSASPEAHEHFVTIPTRVWKVGFVLGAVVWLVSAVVTEVTDDDILVPTVIILGSFLVPGTLSAFALSRRREGYLTTEEVVLGFLLAGTAFATASRATASSSGRSSVPASPRSRARATR